MKRFHIVVCIAVALLTALVALAPLDGHGGRGDRQAIELYDRFREAALAREWSRAEHLYQELRATPLPPEVRHALGYHSALLAYDAREWATATARCEAALAADQDSPWRPSLYELLGRSLEQLGEIDKAVVAYKKTNLPAAELRTRALLRRQAALRDLVQR